MARFSSLVKKGLFARDNGVVFSALDSTECVCDLRLLDGDDTNDILVAARDAAVAKKADPKRGDAIYDYEIDVQKILRICVDPDSPADAPAPFFDSATQVRANLDQDRIAFLIARQELFQEKVSPLKRSFTTQEIGQKVLQIATAAEGDDSPFENMGQSSLRELVRILVFQSIRAATPKSFSTSSVSVEPSSKKDPTIRTDSASSAASKSLGTE